MCFGHGVSIFRCWQCARRCDKILFAAPCTSLKRWQRAPHHGGLPVSSPSCGGGSNVGVTGSFGEKIEIAVDTESFWVTSCVTETAGVHETAKRTPCNPLSFRARCRNAFIAFFFSHGLRELHLHLGYEACRGLRINLDHLGVFRVHQNL